MKVQVSLESQYRAALRMLRVAIQKCPPSLWNAPRDRDKTWSRALHTVYYAHKYLQQSAQEFVPWKGQTRSNGGDPLARELVLEYVDFVEAQVPERLRNCNFEAASGFSAYPNADRLELHIINIRHIQHHAAELYERIGARRDPGLRWLGTAHRKAK